MKTMILRDPVHDLVRFETEEEAIVPALLETREVQRLRRIKQLGVTNLVYAGAEHSRFTHAIGSAHVMTKLIRRLRELHDELPFWQRLASDRARDVLAGALLHDVGHGPYSHLFEEAIPRTPSHEEWSLAIVKDPSTDVHKILVAHDPGLPERVAQLVSGGEPKPYPLPYLAHAVSGTLDVDRCDYLLRDAYMTGVRYGLFDLDWLFRSLRFGPTESNAAPRLAIDGMKGLPAIEGFVIARRFMYEQVYLHKATRAAEAMIKAIFARAARVILDGTPLQACPAALHLAAHAQPIPLGDYLALDDVIVGAAFAAWESAPDPVLADLCARVRRRHRAKTIELFGEATSPAVLTTLTDEARALAVAAGLDPDAHVTVDVAEASLAIEPPSAADGELADDPSAQRLEVVLGDGHARPLGAVSSILAQLPVSPVRRVRLIVAPEIRDAVAARVAALRLGV
ncbi:MAG: HD domain-containing protein [Polyangiales bacterium]